MDYIFHEGWFLAESCDYVLVDGVTTWHCQLICRTNDGVELKTACRTLSASI